MKPLIIYHAHCTDGFGAAFAAWLKFGDMADYLPMNYGDPEHSDVDLLQAKIGTPDNRQVYVLDFSFPIDITKWLIKNAPFFVWLDHHKTAFEMWAGNEREFYMDETEYTNILLDNSKSGALLAWEYFHPEQEAPLFIKLIDDRDRWQFKYESSKSFHMAMQMFKPWTFEKWQLALQHTDKIVQHGQTLLDYQEHQVKSITKYAMNCALLVNLGRVNYPYDDTPVEEILTGLAVNTSVHMSEVGHELANKSGTFGMIWYLGENGEAKVSLRSNGDYDVSAIAKQFGGGGHKNASGFSVDIQTLLGWLK